VDLHAGLEHPSFDRNRTPAGRLNEMLVQFYGLIGGSGMIEAGPFAATAIAI
jgi:hypothetical protein